jgi:hypothetical protein
LDFITAFLNIHGKHKLGAFASPLSDNTVTLCTILNLPVMEYARTKLVPSFIAAGMAAVLFGVTSFIMR